ncbi:MAG: ergothioneine biosynthesis protein EgtB, partial [Alphaproteobacteria bacterium]|nr:ergothioneine biosynthesis protein EgtB [Alphaproteobacteria bacterium]
MDILHAFSMNSVAPAYQAYRAAPARKAPELRWFDHDGGLAEIGHDGPAFAFDNEGPRHTVHLEPFRLASRLVTNAEWKDFMADGGYERPELWLSDGWATVGEAGWTAPLYWQEVDGVWMDMSLSGLQQVNDQAPVCHVSLYEADAYARWAGKRLPREEEWEVFAAGEPVEGNFLGSGLLRTAPATGEADDRPEQMFGDVWEWTQSAYSPYPGFRPVTGAVGEYNGKFMANQFVLRGGACVTPEGHTRATYRNFFYPAMRWMFSGVRLADDR